MKRRTFLTGVIGGASLTAYDDKLKPQPMLAESWDMSSDARSIKFNLRKGVHFRSGREVTSDDVTAARRQSKGCRGPIHGHGQRHRAVQARRVGAR